MIFSFIYLSCSVIKSMDSWLCADDENVAVVHCKVRFFVLISNKDFPVIEAPPDIFFLNI